MIILQEFFDILATGEFSNIALGNSQRETIVEAKYPKIINSMNLGLIELYKRFTLKKKEIDLHEQADIFTYLIRSDYVAASIDLVDSQTYLIDSEEDPFSDDLIKIIEAYDADQDEILINDKRYPEVGIFTMAHDTIKLTPADTPRVLSLTYLASYPKIIIDDDFKPKEVKLYFPDWIQEPLLLYIAARLFMGKTSKVSEGNQNMHTTFFAAYENACRKIELFGLAEINDEPSETFENGGWC